LDVELTDDQELFRATTAKFIANVCPLETVRAMVDAGAALPDRYLTDAGELGWFSLLVSEENGGGSVSGRGLLDAAIVAEERGRVLQPTPFVPMNVVALALSESGSAEQRETLLPAILAGESVATWVASNAAGAWGPGQDITAAVADGKITLSGRAGLVLGGQHADWLLVTASGPGGLVQVMVPTDAPGVTVTALAAHDITQGFAAIDFGGVRVDAVALVGAGSEAQDIERQFQHALVLSIAETLGAMDTVFELTRQYALDRIAFGRPIGSFQAVKHQLADMALQIETGMALSVAATAAVQDGRPDAGEITSIAKAWVADIGIDIAQGCFQVFAGIGYTWEHDFHFYLRRITMNSLLFGNADWHRERICQLQGL
jgi:alkylation response protein AidB-like acyl-CoA dehydrogenase